MQYKGRAAQKNIPNRFEKIEVEVVRESEAGYSPEPRQVPTEFYRDNSKSVIAKNDSADIFFEYSVNPYRGCEHGCIYCYARPTHDYLGFSSGLEFETKIMVKDDAPELLDKELSAKGYEPKVIAFSGNTDCYQPVEKELELTRRCLQVCLYYRNPVSVLTKNHLITRDTDILSEMAEMNIVITGVSITTLDKDLAAKMEPRAASPSRRLKTIEALAKAGIPVGVSIAPVVPGLTDAEIPQMLQAAADHGAQHASWIMLRLPHSLDEMFTDWLLEQYPNRASKIIKQIIDVRGNTGEMYDSTPGVRGRGTGPVAQSIAGLFRIGCLKSGISQDFPELNHNIFRRSDDAQLSLF